MGKRILLTGATGLLGSHILRQGLSRGYVMYVLAREISPRTYLFSVKDNANIKILTCDLLNLDLDTLPTDIDTVIHCAGLASSRNEDADKMWQLNVVATQSLYEFYRHRRIQWVQVSSVSTMCDGKSPLIDESFQGQRRDTEYARTKLEIDQWLEKQNKDILFLHPCFMLGEWDSKPSSGIIFYALKMKKISEYQNRVKNFVDAQDVAVGLLQALEANVQGHYLLGHHNIDIESFLKQVCAEMGVPFTAAKIDKEFSDEFSKEFCAASAVNFEKAVRDFGYNPSIPLEVTIKNTMDYFSKMKMLRRVAT